MRKRPLYLPRVLHPGEILDEDFLRPYEISQFSLACALRVSPRRINEIILGKRRITADTAMRLGIFYGNGADFWMEMQAHYELTCLRLEKGERLEKELGRLAEYA